MNLAAQLPLTGAEKKIAPAARTLLTSVETYIQGQFNTLKTPAAITSFWNSLGAYGMRNHTASLTNGTIGNGTTATTTAAPAARTPARRQPARAKAKARTRSSAA